MGTTTLPPPPKTKPKAPRQEPGTQGLLKFQPRYNVILVNDDDHTVDYVVFMMKKLFGKKDEEGIKIAKTVHTEGRCVVLTTTKEHAELKQEQIHAFGPDPLIPRCKGSMSSEIEPAE
jgi:ATP-dependent Clp protease adaptor protein ClpS